MEGIAGVEDWVAVLRVDRLDRVAAIRLDHGTMGALDSERGEVWLRGKNFSKAVCAMPFQDLYRLEVATGRLFPLGSDLPERKLPDSLDWEPLAELVLIEGFTSDFPTRDGSSKGKVELKRGGDGGQSPNVLVTELQTWCGYASSAPEIRLAGLTFAASGEEVIVRGTPLPPVAGQSWLEEKGLAIPCGWRVDPPVSGEVIRNVIGAATGEIVLLHPDGTIDRIPGENFVPASRAAVRLSATK